MRHRRMMVCIAAVAVMAALAAQAADQPGQKTAGKETPVTAGGAGAMQAQGQTAGALMASQCIGADVKNLQGEDIGEIEDIVLDQNLETVSYLVLATGGFLGIGEELVPVPLQAFRMGTDPQNLRLDLTKDTIQNAPKLGDEWPTDAQSELNEAKRFFARHIQAFQRGASQAAAETAARIPTAGETETTAQAQPRQPGQQPGAGATIATATPEQKRWARRASNLIGIDVQNQQNNQIGSLTDMVVDASNSGVSFGLINVENVQGLENQMVAAPWTAISILPQQEVARLNASDTALRAAAFRSENMPDFSNRGYVRNVYQQFNQEPYWTKYGFEGEEGGRSGKPMREHK